MPRLRVLLFGVVVSVLPVAAQPRLGDCPVFPANHVLNTPIDKAPLHPKSAVYVNSIGPSKELHPDFGPSGAVPYNVVPAGTPKSAVVFTDGAAESDLGPYPIPSNPVIEAATDAHMLLLSQGECRLYELYYVERQAAGNWTASSGAIWDLRSNVLRPDGWTSADAAGLAILPGLVRYDEIAAGAIRHAIRFTASPTVRDYLWPARHYASRSNDDTLPPMGLRMRLRADYDVSGFSPVNQVILTALKKYGMILADNGGAWFITGSPDPRWDDADLNNLKRVKGSDFEAVDTSGFMISGDSAQVGPPLTSLRVDVPYSPSPTFDLAVGATVFSMTMAGDVNASTFANLIDGQTVSIILCQDDAGYHRFRWPSNVVGGIEIADTPGRCAAQSFVSDGSQLYATSTGVKDLMPNVKPLPTGRPVNYARKPVPR